VDDGSGFSLVGGYVDPEMDEWQIVSQDGGITASGRTTPAFIAEAPPASQLRVLTEGCVAFASPATLPPVTDAGPAEGPSQVEEIGSRFVSLAGEDDAEAAALGAYGADSTWFPRQLADVLDSIGFDVSTAEEGADGFSYWLVHPEQGQRLLVYVGTAEGVPTVIGYGLLGGCQ
jgi:hypothetical protein